MKKYSLLLFTLLAILIFGCKKEKTAEKEREKIWALYDKDGYGYDTVKIGTQFWMKQNLNTSRYRNGDAIPQITSASIWSSLTTGAWCWYNNDSATYASTYGKLYNWFAINDARGLAPQGWHVPSIAEVNTLLSVLGGSAVAGGKMKATGTNHWVAPNTNADNTSGFTALPSGVRNNAGNFFLEGNSAIFRTSTPNGGLPYNFSLNYNDGKVGQGGSAAQSGQSIRCMKD
jgi:uncharacterized protein (TIGR02145 family)